MPKLTGSLDRFKDKTDLQGLDPVQWTRWRHESAPRQLKFTATTKRDAQAWQKELRARLAQLVGGFPRRTPLKPQVLEVREFPTYRREAILMETRPGLAAFGYLLVPNQRKGPHPVMVCVPGHGRGADDIVGIDDKGNDRTERVGYQFDFAIQAVENGMAAFAVEPMAFGCRRGREASRKSLTTSSCQPAAGAALLYGETMIGWRVWDVMRSIDYLETRPEIDAKRTGLMGISGGGTCTLFGAALDTRVQAAFVSCYFCTFKDSVLSLSHCIDNYVPGILNWAEMSDVAGLIAPRHFFAESGIKDNIFPVDAARAGFIELQRIYRVFGAPERCAHEVFEGPHIFHGGRGWEFVRGALGVA